MKIIKLVLVAPNSAFKRFIFFPHLKITYHYPFLFPKIVNLIFVTCDSFHCVYFSLPHSWWRKVKLRIREISIEHHFWLFMIHCDSDSQNFWLSNFMWESSLGSFVLEIIQLLNPLTANPLTRLTLTGWSQGLPGTPPVRRTFTPLPKNLIYLKP